MHTKMRQIGRHTSQENKAKITQRRLSKVKIKSIGPENHSKSKTTLQCQSLSATCIALKNWKRWVMELFFLSGVGTLIIELKAQRMVV